MASEGDRQKAARETRPTSPLVYVLLLLSPVVLLVPVLVAGLVLALSARNSMVPGAHAIEGAVGLAIALSSAAAIAWLIVLTHRLHRLAQGELDASTRSLSSRTVVRDLIGLARKVRGNVDGRECVVTPDALEVEVASPPDVIGKKSLEFEGVSLRVQIERERIVVHGTRGRDAATVARAALALAGIAPPLVVLPDRAAPSATCPYCKDVLSLAEREGAIRCPTCETSHHASCWKDNAGCAIHGCERGPRGRDARAVERREAVGGA